MNVSIWRLPGQALSKLKTTPAVWTFLHESLCILAPVFLFLCFFDIHVLDPTRIGWTLEADWGQHVLGWNAFRHEPWSTFNHESLLYWPAGLTVIYTDSNPLFAFPFKAISPWLPAHFQYIGIWFFVCVCLHFIFAYKLVKPHAPNRWAALGGAMALSALPAFYYRMRHDTLMAQWTILWALHLVVNVADDRLPDPLEKGVLPFVRSWFKQGTKMCGWAALLGVTGLIHPYLLFMLAAMWGGDVLKRLWPAARTMDRKVLLDAAVRGIFVLIWPLITLGISGAYAQGQSPGAGGWSWYSAGLDAFFNPVRQDFSNILKAWPLNGGQSFEGYQYLGFGLLALIALAPFLYGLTPEAKASRPFFARLKPLILPFVVLTAIALTNRVQIYGQTVLFFELPEGLRGTAAVLRASGRFLWPVGYCAVFAALVVLFKSRLRIVAAVLPAVLVLQAYDLGGFAEDMRDATAQAGSTQIYYQTPSPLWDKLVAASDGVDFYPANVHMNDKLFYELTWRATSAAKPVNTMYPARENLVQMAHEVADQDAFKRGTVRNDRLLVFLKQCDAPPQLQSRLRMLDGQWIIPPDAAKDIPLDMPVWNPIKAKVRFGWLDQGTCMLDENWSPPDTEGVWSDGPKAAVQIPIKHIQFDTLNPKALDLDLNVGTHVPLLVSVLVNGKKVSELALEPGRSKHLIALPASALRGDTLNVGFVAAKPEGETEPVAIAPAPLSGRARLSGRPAIQLTAKAKDAGLAIKLMNMDLVEHQPTQPPVHPAVSG